MHGLHRQGFYEECREEIGESLVGPTDLDPRDSFSPTTAIIGFPARAACDPTLAIDDFRVLISVGILVGSAGNCAEDIDRIAGQTALTAAVVMESLERLALRGYVSRRHLGNATMISLVPDSPDPGESATSPAPSEKSPPSPRRSAGRSAQASLHSGMLRRPARRQSGAIEFDDPLPPHPVVASLQKAMQSKSGGVDGFRFWLRTILDPEDVEVFSGWAGRQSTEYRLLVDKFDRADDDQTIESLLDDTLALVNREKRPNR